MRFKHFDEAVRTLEIKYGVDAIKEVILHQRDRIICYAKFDENDLEMHVIFGSFAQMGYEDLPSLNISKLFNDMDLNNSYADVAGENEYKKDIVKKVMRFRNSKGITFPIRNKKGRTWLHLAIDIIDRKQELIALHFTIITSIIKPEEEIFEKTHHDSLTGLLNKYSFDFHYGARYKNDNFHVMFLDLDDFKILNDIMGHKEGNQYLVEFAKILKKYEKGHSRFYRLGGDEFIGLMFETEERIHKIAKGILKETEELSKNNPEINTSVSIGIVRATKREDVARKADKVMYEAKKLGKNCYIYKVEE